MCSSCGTGRPTPPWEAALGDDRSHRALRARALTAAAASTALRFTADPATRAYHVHRATAPQQTAYDLAQCTVYLPRPQLPTTEPADAETSPLDCPLDVWAVVLQLHAGARGPHRVRVADAGSAMEVALDGADTTMAGPVIAHDGPYLHVAGPNQRVLLHSLHRTAAAVCRRLYLTYPESA